MPTPDPTRAARIEQMRRMIKSSGLTRPQVAEALGVSVATVDAWMASENARMQRAPNEPALRLAEKLLKPRKDGGK